MEDFIQDMEHRHPRLRFGTLNIAMPEWTAQRLLSRVGESEGLVEDGEALGKVSVLELPK